MAKRYALLIGASAYGDPRLRRLQAPAADVESLAAALRDSDIAGFDHVLPLVEPSKGAAIEAVDELFADKARDDLVLLYFSGHGIRDDHGRLFFALGGTRYDRPRGTGISASELKHFLDDCRSRRQVLILDCCHAGAFMESQKDATAAPALTEETFEVRGYGREILAATNATAYAFEGEEAKGDGTSRQLGKFTRFLVEGLRTGAGVEERDEITVGDLFEHARRRLAVEEPRMRPQHWRERGEAPLVIARNPQARPRLPAELLAALDDRGDWLKRRGAVDWLDEILKGGDARLRAAAVAELRRREPDEEHRRVHERMVLVLRGVEAAMPVAPPLPLGEREWPAGHVFRDVDAPWCPELVVIPPGRFVMGSPDGEEERTNDEGPQHEVQIGYRFALGRYTVTFSEYDAFCEATGHPPPGDEGWGRGRRPVIHVSWEDATAYCLWLTNRTGKHYRLPSEAEWEYAARAGTTTPFWIGETISTAQVNYNGNSIYGTGSRGEFRRKTVPVDAPGFPTNPFGLQHLHGNVWEWVQDSWHGSYRGAPSDGRAWVEEKHTQHVLRGGSWGSNARSLRAANRGWDAPGFRLSLAGFRVARILDAPSEDPRSSHVRTAPLSRRIPG
jgi:formylglycine-generating enzyme required for sulfatase activity